MPAWDHKHPEEFRAAARKDLERYKTVQIEKTEITKLEKTADGLFRATDQVNKTWLGRKVILASGVYEIYPDLEGYSECWAKGM